MLFVSFPRHAVLDPELLYPDVLMDRWPGMVFVGFRPGCAPFCAVLCSVYSRVFSHRMPSFCPYFPGPVHLHSIGVYVSQPSFNWLLLCWVFLTGKRTSVFTCLADWWRRATTTDILQCVNKRIFQQSICVVCGLFGNLLVEIDKNIRLVAHSNN